MSTDLSGAQGAPAVAGAPSGFPVARRGDVVERLHGRVVADPYRWLEDGDGAECVAWLAEQEELFRRHAGGWSSREWFRSRLAQQADPGPSGTASASPPVVRGTRRFRLRRRAGEQLPSLVVAEGGTERVVVDPLRLDPSGATTLDAWRPSWGGDLVAYQITRGGSERPSLRVLEVTGGGTVDGLLAPGRRTSVAWLSGDAGFYYVSDPTDGSVGRQLRLHRVGAGTEADDPVVFATELPQMSVKTSPDGRWLALSAAAGATSGNTLWLAALDPHRPWEVTPRAVFDGRERAARAVLRFGPGGGLYAATDDAAPHGRLCALDPADPGGPWRTVLAEQPPAVLGDYVVLADPGSGATRLLVSRTRHGIGELTLHDGDGAALAEVALPGRGTVTGLTAPPGGAQAWLSYTDYTTPPTVHRVRLPVARCAPAGGATAPTASDPLSVEEVAYSSADGTTVRMHVVSPAHAPADRPLPTLLTGYGSFGASCTPGYSPAVTAWVGAGGRYAITHVRGGGEHGTDWHTAGRRRNKPRAVADFTAAAQWLIEHGRTAPEKLAARGGSAAGLLTAAAVVQRPDLYAAAVCTNAVTDMLRYRHFGMGHLWTEEFGTSDDPDDLDVLLGYSPYHRIDPGTRYPAVLVTSPRVDPRVDAMHSRKLTAALQHATTSTRPVLLRSEPDTGHGPGTTTRWSALQADILAFCATHTGLVV